MNKKSVLTLLLSATLATTAHAATIYNGDKIAGLPVITKLDVSDLKDGKTYRFMFKGSDMNIGQSWYVPVIVAKGSNPGPKLLLDTGIHGDELNGSRVVQVVFENLDPKKLSGTVIGVLQASPNSLMHINRNWFLSGDGGGTENMNRIFPGKITGNSAEVQAYLLWNNLWSGNANYVIDLHTQSTDTSYPLFIYADYRIPSVKNMAELIPADQIKIDQGEPGSVETTFDQNKIPAITLEVGQGRSYQPELISRANEGINNIMVDLKMIKGTIGRTASTFGSYIGNDMVSVKATQGGYSEIFVATGDNVTKGQKIAVQRNPFGDVTKEYTAPESGKVLSIGTGATREQGGTLVRILTKNPDTKCNYGC